MHIIEPATAYISDENQTNSIRTQRVPVHQETEENDMVVLYAVGRIDDEAHESKPFIAHFTLRNEATGTAVRVKGLVDDGAMVNVMDTELWERIKSRLKAATPSEKRLRMANGVIVPSEGKWSGAFEFEGVRVESSFELFPSRRAWSFLIGKPMLEALRARHDYSMDTIAISNKYTNAIVRNQRGKTWGDNSLKAKGLNLTSTLR